MKILHIRIFHDKTYFQARALLDTSELSLLMFLLGQYRGHQMAITPLVTRSAVTHDVLTY